MTKFSDDTDAILYHCFPRPSLEQTAGGTTFRTPRSSENDVGLSILRSILENGLVCSSERLCVETDPRRVSQFGVSSKLETVSMQTRACFTHCTRDDLIIPRGEARFQREDGAIVTRPASHLDLFGSFGIGLDPDRSRRLGVMPAMYFYRLTGVAGSTPEDLLRRLAEARQVLIALHLIEERSGQVAIPFIDTDVGSERTSSKSLAFELESAEVQAQIDNLTPRAAQSIFKLFEVDRRSSWQIVDKLDSILGLFQNTDSTIDDSSLAFYEQREWRLPFNFQENLRWFSLGNHPEIRDPAGRRKIARAARVREVLKAVLGRPLRSDDLQATWILYEVDGQPFNRMISEIICPEDQVRSVRELLDKLKKERVMSRDIKIKPVPRPEPGSQ